jgi:mRNA-degrading endonuclease RelE of RelBE toxin-antitoxin system
VISFPVRLKPSPQFLKSCKKLGEPLGGRIRAAIKKFQEHPDGRGLNFEAVKNAPGTFTIRVNRNFRILLRLEEDETGPYYLLADVGTHKDTYF